jgi:hypothetical protein
VCGSNGKTYINSCSFDIANCQASGKLTFKPGKCPPKGPKGPDTTLSPPTKNCPRLCPGYIKYVCGSNGKTYINSCYFNGANCEAGGKLTLKPGKCPPKGPKGLDTTLSPPTKNCPRLCPGYIKYVCGSNGETYVNSCYFNGANCEAGGKLTLKPGKCPPKGPKGLDTTLSPPY